MYNSHNIRGEKQQRNKTKAMWSSQERKEIKQENLGNIKINMARISSMYFNDYKCNLILLCLFWYYIS